MKKTKNFTTEFHGGKNTEEHGGGCEAGKLRAFIYLTTRNSSQNFFGQLYELFRKRRNYNTFISEIEKILIKINCR